MIQLLHRRHILSKSEKTESVTCFESLKMSVRRISSLKDDSHDLQKQIGCMNGIFQIFDRHHFLSGRRSSGHRHKRLLLQGAQQQQDNEQAKSAKETPKEKPRISTESSYSSSTCSTSTFSSMDYNRAAQLEPRLLRQINVPESTVRKEQQQPSKCKNTAKPLDVRDVVKDSVYREVRGLSVKSREANEKKGGRVLKHIDSPRPSLQLDSEKPKARGCDGGVNVIRSCREERLALPRYSYDGRESRGGKHKEHPRLSLDSKTSSMKYSALESRANFLIRDQNAQHKSFGEAVPLSQETGSHRRTSSLVAKLMGLETFPDAALYEDSTPVLKPCAKEDSMEPIRQGDASYFRKPTEPSPAAAPRKLNRKAPTDTPRLSLSVYGEIEKRITELEFKKSGKDLRALKQILEAMQKTRERLESEENSNLLTWKDGKSNGRNPNNQRQLGASHVVITRPAKVADKIDYSYSPRNSSTEMPQLQRLHTREPRYQREVAVHGQKAKDCSPRNGLNDSCRNLPSPGKKASWRPSEMERTSARPRTVVENCATSPRLQQNLQRAGSPSCRPTTPTSDRRDIKKCHEKKVVEKASQNRKTKVKPRDLQASDDQFSEISSDTRYSSYQGDTASVKSESNNSLASVTESDIIQRKNYTSRTKKSMAVLESIVTTVEQPSPISVLDDAFYCEDSPSPVKKTSTAFQDDVSRLVEAEWHLEDMKPLRECTRSDMLNRKLESMKHRIRELSLLSNEPNVPFMNHNEVACDSHDPDHRYINKVLLTSGLLKDLSFISATDSHVSSYHLINPDMFHVIEQTEDCHGEIAGKKLQRKIIFDMVNEILIRKINSGRFSVGKKATSPQALLKEIYLEMDRARLVSDCSLDDGEDEITRILTADMKYQSEDWGNYKGEKPPLVLDVERLIFKDLINDVIIGEAMEARDRTKRHQRQLFRT